MNRIIVHHDNDLSGVTLDGFPVFVDNSDLHVFRARAFKMLCADGKTSAAQSEAYEARLPYKWAKVALKIHGESQ